MAFKFDVVISGISGRFPECDDLDTFKRKLYSGNRSEFVTTSERKWTRGFKLHRYGDKAAVPDAYGKYLKDIDFDYRLFKFNQMFGRSTDIINRKMLEPSFEAIVDAGINPYSLDGANVGVFTSGGISERETYCVANIKNHVFVLGSARTMAPNRLSYALNFRGPSYAFHTDPLGGFEALKVAKDLISDGSIEAAIVSVSSNIADPKYNYLYMHLDLVSSGEFCRSFDKNADGFVRSESTVAFFLQREQDAKRHYAKLLLCDNVFEGLSSHTLLGYDEEYVKNSLTKIYERNMLDVLPEEIGFLELTGCAVKKFESSEANAVADVLCKRRTTPLMIGSVKSSVGHAEASSGFLSILKTLLVLDSQLIPPNCNLSELNDDIRALREKQLQVVDKKTEFCGSVAAVNIVGLWGTVNHVVLQNNVRKRKPISDNIPRLLLLSGRTAEGLRQVFKKIESDHFNAEAIGLANEVFQKNMPFHVYRGFTILPKTEKTTAVVDESGHPQRPICFIFSGMGSQWNGMGQQLLDFPVIAEVIKRCDAVLKPKSIDIYKVLLSEDPTIFDDITMSFVAIICMQIALVEVLKKLNIVPDIIVGHSVGENGCAYVDGCLTLEQAVLVSYNRGIASTSTKTIKGMMAAVGKGYEEIRHDIPENIEIACHNAFNSCTLSGPAEDIDAYVETLKNQGVFAKSVNVANIAYHSKYIAPAAPKLLELLQKVIPEPKKRSSKWISSSVPELAWHSPIADRCSAEYLTNNLLKPVLFEEACKHIPKDAVCIEIAPHGLLQAILKRSLPETCTNISLTLRSAEKNNLNFLLTSIGKLFVAGCEPAVNNLYPRVEYPVSRGTPSISPFCTWFYGDVDAVAPPYKPAQSIPLSRENIAVRINRNAEFQFLKYHQINETTIIPPAFFIYLVWRMLAVRQKVNMDEFPVLFERIRIHKNLTLSISKPRLVNILIQGSGFFEVLSRAKNSKKENKVILTGRVEFFQDKDFEIPSADFDPVESKFVLDANEINAILKNAGFLLGECFQLLTAVKLEDAGFQGNIEWRGNWVTFLDSIMKFQMFSDLRKSKLRFLKTIRRMVLVPSVLNSQNSGSLVTAKYCKVTKCFQCNGVEVYDAKWKADDRLTASRLHSSLKIRQMKFVSYSNPSCQSLDEFVDLCLQISLESLETSSKTGSKFYLRDYTGKFSKSIRRSETIYDLGKEKVIFSDNVTPPFESLSHNTFLFIAAEKMPDINVSHLEEVYVLLIMSEYDSKTIPTDFATILGQSFGNETFILLKKKLNYVPAIRVENGDAPPCGLSNGTNRVENEIVIRPKLDKTSLTLMFSKTHRHNSRYVFANGHEPCIDNEPTFMSKLVTGLPVIVMKNQDWGSYRYQSSDSVNSSNDDTVLKNSLMDVKIESICVEFIRPELATPSLQSDEDLATLEKSIGIEFSGVNAAGQKLMGLTMANSYEPVSKLDPSLTWNVPEEWTLEEAASVPLHYAHVFHIPKLIERSVYLPSPKVLINAGEDMIIVEICVSMCVTRGYQVYVVVSSAEQVHRLRRNCPWLNESRIILSNGGFFDCDLLLRTKNQGVNVVINYSSGLKNLTCTLNCVSLFAYYIETVQSNMNEIYEIGMRPFVLSFTFIAFPRSISSLHNLRKDDKEVLHEAVNKGIETGLVRPIKELTLKEPSIRIDNRDVSNESKLAAPISNGDGRNAEKFGIRHRHSHVIFGGECSEESWINLIYWLKGKGGTNFVVLVEKFPTKQRMSQLLNRLLADKNTVVSFKLLKQLTSVKDAFQLMQETSKIAPINSVFFVSLDSGPQRIHFMDVASQQFENSITFFSLFSGGLEEMELRRSRGRPAFVLHGGSLPKNVMEVMEAFEKTLSNYNLKNSQDILYQIIEKRQLSNSEDTLSSLRNYLPKTVDCLEEIGRHLSGTVEFVEITSRCLKLNQCRGVLPIFVVPGLHASEIQSFLHSLIYPVFCASLSEDCSSVSHTAAKLHEHLNKIQPLGPVTLIGETWNGAVAIELSSMIKQCGRDFRLFLLQGNPVEWKETVKNLNLTDYHDFENTLIQIYGEELTTCLSPKVNADKNCSPHTNSAAFVRRCLNVLKRQFNNVYDYNADNAIIENTVLFSETVRQNITSDVSNTSDIICIKEDKYENFIRSPIISKKINKLAMFSWNL